ncbi:hypothetical protein DFH09DRAFT_1355731 [Mycena vulgaris]|nr:hypothetical protein DFH09DRAFT_1355731 [Mycena vulgaris]
MPPATRRGECANKLLKWYIRNHKGRQRRALLRRRAAARARQANPLPRGVQIDLDRLTSDSESDTSSDSDSSHSSTSSSDSAWSDILGPNWRFTGDMLVDGDFSITELDDLSESTDTQDMPDLFSVGSDSSASDSDSESDWNWSSGADGDDEDNQSDEDTNGIRPPLLRRWIRSEIDDMYEHRYEQPRNTLPRGPSYLHHVLMALKTGRPDHFRQNLRVSPLTFDALIAVLENDPIFFNNSNHPQLPVEQQPLRTGLDWGKASSLSAARLPVAVLLAAIVCRYLRILPPVTCILHFSLVSALPPLLCPTSSCPC